MYHKVVFFFTSMREFNFCPIFDIRTKLSTLHEIFVPYRTVVQNIPITELCGTVC